MSRLILLLILVSLAYSEPPAPRNNLDDHPAALPEASQDKSSDSQSLNLGQKISLDRLGPAIVNEDGTLRRIANWDSLTPLEQAVAFRRIAERNKQRLESLKQQQEIEEQGMEIDPEDIISSSDQLSNNTGQDIYALNASDFVLIALIAVVLITVLPSKIRRMLRRLSAAKNQSIKSD